MTIEIVTDINLAGQYPDWVLVIAKRKAEVNVATGSIVLSDPDHPQNTVTEEIDLGP